MNDIEELIDYIAISREWDNLEELDGQVTFYYIQDNSDVSMILIIAEKHLHVYSLDMCNFDDNYFYLNSLEKPNKNIIDLILNKYFTK
jgi:hypothetical protein